MNKIEKIQKKVREAEASREGLESEVSALKEKLPEVKASAERKAEAGDVEGYIQLKGQADRIGAEIHVKELQLKRAENPITKEEALEAWTEYIKPINATFEKQLTAYKNARRELCSQLRETIAKGREADAVRRQLLSYCGMEIYNTNPAVYKHELELFSMKRMAPKDASDDINFFRKVGELTLNESTDLNGFLLDAIM